jgi:hypothetical protein
MVAVARGVAALCIMLVVAVPAGSQAVRPVVSSSWPAASDVVVRADGLRPVRLATTAPSTRRIVMASFSVVGGAVLGAGLGYFLSQVVKSDWEGMRTAERASHRRRFALSGAAVGALAGFLARPRVRSAGVEPPRTYVYVAPSERHYIARDELRRAPVLNALEAVQQLRPEWLAGSQYVSHGTNGSSSDGGASIAVYVIDRRVGGLEALADISIPEVEELRLYERREAERRWGTVLPLGAIEVVPAAAAPTK